MSLYAEIYSDVAPLFKFATTENYHVVRYRQESTERIFQNCVRCNVKRFEQNEVSFNLPANTDCLHCSACHQEFARVVRKYDKGVGRTKEFLIFEKILNKFMFGRLKA